MIISLEKPVGVPTDIFDTALRTFLECRRLDMKSLAAELEISRATLYRRAPGRDELLGEVIWFLTRHAAARALDGAADRHGAERLLAVITAFMDDVHSQPALRRLLDREPEAALRILTTRAHPIQRGLIEFVQTLIDEEIADASLDLPLDRATTAYLVVRAGESFLYADVIADQEPNLLAAAAVVARLLGAELPAEIVDIEEEFAQ